MKTCDYINRVVLTLPLTVYEGTWTHSPLSLLCITMILRVRRNFFEITTFPNSLDIGSVPGEIGILPEYREVTGTPREVNGP